MHFRVTSDTNSETRVGEVIYKISGPTRIFFEEKNYGSSIEGIGIVFMCRDPKLVFKQRIRFSKADRKLYVDIMMDYQEMVSALNDDIRATRMKEKLLNELPPIVMKYKFEDFNAALFFKDLKKLWQH